MTGSTARKVTEVAVGVLLGADSTVLLADRPAGKAYAGYWEFPGGKIEPGETVAQALARELHEELGLTINATAPWVTFEFDYPHAYVRLHFVRVYEWTGAPHGREGQRFLFHRIGDDPPHPLLPAAVPALKWLALPEVLVVSRGDGGSLGMAGRWGQVLGSDELRNGPHRPEHEWTGAWVQGRTEIEAAAALGLDYALLGPVIGPSRHDGLGWKNFAEMARATPLPLFAHGGIGPTDLAAARRHGAHGVAVSVAA